MEGVNTNNFLGDVTFDLYHTFRAQNTTERQKTRRSYKIQRTLV
jgi:hypothetical protein